MLCKGVLLLEKEWYNIQEVAEKFGVTTMTIRRWIKKGKFPGAMMANGIFGPEYRIPAADVYPDDVIIEKGIVEVAHTLTQEELSALLLNVLRERENGLETKQDTLELKVVELSDRINVLVDKIEDMQKKQENIPWWRRWFGGGGK
jgi:excisionase family DNA binding protein